MVRQLYKEDIEKYTESNKCLPKSAKMYIDDPETGIINMTNFNTAITENGGTSHSIPTCDDSFYNTNSDTSGCCKIAFNESLPDSCKDGHSTGLKVLQGDETYNVCHKDPVQQIFNSFIDDPNKIIKFFKLIFVAIVVLLVTATIGCYYEFWLRYGE